MYITINIVFTYIVYGKLYVYGPIKPSFHYNVQSQEIYVCCPLFSHFLTIICIYITSTFSYSIALKMIKNLIINYLFVKSHTQIIENGWTF